MNFAHSFQGKMADYMKGLLGDLLFVDQVDESRTSLPSPEELKRKILVKKTLKY